MTLRTVTIEYRRLPDRLQRFEQTVLAESSQLIVTFLEAAQLTRPKLVAGQVILEAGAPIVWFTYPGRWYDIGRFHLRDGTFTGVYANVLTPVSRRADQWKTTDLCLDVWQGVAGDVAVLDQDEFADAVRREWIDERVAEIARDEAEKIATAARAGRWPPDEVARWTLRRAVEQMQMLRSTGSIHARLPRGDRLSDH